MAHANGTNGNGSHPPPLPDTWDQAQVDSILLKMSEGKSLRDACLDVGIPRQTFMKWVLKDTNGLGGQYVRAREAQMDAMEAEMLAIADDSRGDTTTRRDAAGNEYEVPDNEWINRSKLRVDTRRWIMSKIAPKKYGDRNESTVSVTERKTVIIEIDPNRNHRSQMAAGESLIELGNDGIRERDDGTGS